jgi:hypothetical protein
MNLDLKNSAILGVVIFIATLAALAVAGKVAAKLLSDQTSGLTTGATGILSSLFGKKPA